MAKANPHRQTNNPPAPATDSLPPQTAGRMPPQALEAEMSTLGSMILDVECIGDILHVLSPEHFYRQEHQLVYDALLTLYDRRRAVDLVLLRDELSRRSQLEIVGGVDYLVRLAESVPSAANASHYAHIVRDKAMLRSLIRVTTEICQQAYEAQGEAESTLEQAEEAIFAVTEQKIVGQAESMREIMARTFEMIDQRSGAHVYGVATGFRELDELTGGLQPGEMIVVAARPSMGKTALGLNIAEHIGADNGQGVAVFSLEMGSQQLAERMLCGRAQIDGHRLRQGNLVAHEIEAMHAAAGELSEAPIFVDDSPGLAPLELRAKARRLKMKHDIQAVVIDYLQLMHVPGAESRQQEVSTISRHMKALGRELKIPVIVMSQLNRSPEGREGHRPRMSDLRESGAIEQDADVVMLLHREDYYHSEPEYERTNTAEVIIAKQRNGPTGTVQLIWNPAWTRFLDLAHQPEPMGF